MIEALHIEAVMGAIMLLMLCW